MIMLENQEMHEQGSYHSSTIVKIKFNRSLCILQEVGTRYCRHTECLVGRYSQYTTDAACGEHYASAVMLYGDVMTINQRTG